MKVKDCPRTLMNVRWHQKNRNGRPRKWHTRKSDGKRCQYSLLEPYYLGWVSAKLVQESLNNQACPLTGQVATVGNNPWITRSGSKETSDGSWQSLQSILCQYLWRSGCLDHMNATDWGSRSSLRKKGPLGLKVRHEDIMASIITKN